MRVRDKDHRELARVIWINVGVVALFLAIAVGLWWYYQYAFVYGR